MGILLFTNLAAGTLAAAITNSATSLSLTSGQGALFPAISGGSGDSFMGILITSGQGASASSEIVEVTARSTDTLTIVRAQESTSASAWAAGTTFAHVPTAGTYGNFVQPGTLQAQGGNYAADTGSANAYVVGLTPAVSAHVVGMPIRWLAAHTNTGVSTFNDGAGVGNLVAPGGGQLAPNAIVAGGLYTSVWDGTEFQLLGGQLVSNTFEPSWTGFSSNPTATSLSYEVNGNLASIIFPSGCYGTSDSTIFEIGGLPAILQPSAVRYVPMMGLMNNNAQLPGGMVAISGSSLTLFPDGTGGAWTASGNKGISVIGAVLLYPL